MFDWARGSMLKKFVGLNMFRAEWTRTDWLKNWHVPWLLGLVEFTPDLCVLDVGSARPRLMKYLHQTFGCDVHALDADTTEAGKAGWGIPADVSAEYPEVTIHRGLAGQELLPAEAFDVIVCISTLEHTYDHNSPLMADKPMPHLHALRDMVRMLKPGGMFLMNWDMYLDNMPQKFGYDFEVDYQILKSGMRLVCNRRRLRNSMYLFSHPETLFFDPVQVLQFKLGELRRGTAINILWRKPGHASTVRFLPRPELEELYFPDGETRPEFPADDGPEPTTAEIDSRFRELISRATDVLGRRDVEA
jgi:SAM-dependent methyltransferase